MTDKNRNRNIVLVAGAAVFILLIAFMMNGGDFSSIFGSNPPAGTVFTVNYADGTSKTYNSKDFQKNELKIIQDNREVKSLTVGVYVTPTWASTAKLTSWSVTGGLQMKIKINAGDRATIYDSGVQPLQYSSSTNLPSSGYTTTVSQVTLTAAQLEQIYPFATATYLFEYSNPQPIHVVLNFDNGDSISADATAPTLQWAFTHTPTTGTSVFNSLSVSFWSITSYT